MALEKGGPIQGIEEFFDRHGRPWGGSSAAGAGDMTTLHHKLSITRERPA
ncbi:MAG: hypothetical protein ACK5R2_02180 [Cyanobacteriota bacterium]|jgi:hypothetical protein